MQQVILGVVFNPAARTLDFSAIPSFNVKRLIKVVNLKTNETLFDSGVENLRGGSPTSGIISTIGNIVTLEYDTTQMNSLDPLQVIYDEPASATAASTVALDTPTIDALIAPVESLNVYEKYQFHHSIVDGSSSYYFFEEASGKYLVKKMEDVSATEQIMTYANISNNPSITTIAAALGNYNTLTYNNISALTGV